MPNPTDTQRVIKKLQARAKTRGNIHPRVAEKRSPEEIAATGKVELTEQQAKFVMARAQGLSQVAAARAAGYEHPEDAAHNVAKSPMVQAALILQRRKFEAEAQMSRKKVLDMLLESYQIAKIQADPTAMIMGAREIGRMCGYYEAVKHKVEVSVSGQVTHQAIRTLSDEELLRLAENGEATGRLLEGSATRVDEETPAHAET